MDDGEHRARIEALMEMLAGIYLRIMKLLALLPIPIAIPPIVDDGDMRDAARALARARMLVLDLPVDDMTKSLLLMMLTEWLAALDLCAVSLHEDEQEGYRIDAVWLMIQRIGSMTEMLSLHLGLDLDV
ncbi:hypothetical protein [Nonomuraea salmonea]|uniref:DUF4254 domain-containing protein n=1 Tax=Nonomuraea salmonea TaxID=46181 RepID=A0ABV5NR79_9ACTN